MKSVVHEAISTFASLPLGRDLGLDPRREPQCFAMSGMSSEYGLVTVIAVTASGRRLVVRIARRKCSQHLQREQPVLASVRLLLRSTLAATVPAPLHLGRVAGHPFLVSTCLPGQPLSTRLRGPARLRKSAFVDSAVAWLAAVGSRTKRSRPTGWHAPMIAALEQAATSRRVDDAIRTKAAWAARVVTRTPDIPCVVQHGDFHSGNVLVNRWGGLTGIIDWVDGDPEGLPGVDLLQLSSSLGTDRRTTGYLLDAYADEVGVSTTVCRALAIGHWLQTRNRLAAVFKHRELVRALASVDAMVMATPATD